MYLYTAQQVESCKELARRLNLTFSAMQRYLKKIDAYDHVRSLFIENAGKPGPKSPPLPLIEGVGADSKPDIEEIKRHLRARYRQKKERAAAKANQHIRFPHGPVAIFFTGDQHIGNAGTDWGRVEDEQNAILETPGSYVWQMGDVVDNFVIGKLVAENMKAGASIMEQWWVAEDYLKRFENKLLAFLAGNHGMWTLKLSGIDYNKEITPEGVLYDSDQIKATIHVGDFQIRVWSRHKWRGNSIFNATHGLERAARNDNPRFDVYVGAHVHKGGMAREFILHQERKIAILSGAYKMVDDYAIEQGFEEHDSSTAVGLVIHEDGRYFASADVYAVQEYMQRTYTQAA